MIQAYPLQWPVGYPRTKVPAHSKFNCTFYAAMTGVMDEVRKLGGKQLVISTNVPLRRDGLPRSGQMPKDRGVAVYFN